MFKSYADVSPEERITVWNNGFSDYLRPINMTSEQLDHRLSSLKMSEDDSKIYYIDNQPAGIYLYADGTFNGKKISWLGGMAVDPTFRGQQVSLRMLEEFERVSKENNVETMYLEAIDGNDRAINIYLKFGFKALNKVLFLGSDVTYIAKNTVTVKEITDLSEINVVEAVDLAWQNKSIHGYDCLACYNESDLIGYVVGAKTGENFVINQIEINKPEVHTSAVLGTLQEKYQPVKWVGSNLLADNETVQSLLDNGFTETLSQHQYIKEV